MLFKKKQKKASKKTDPIMDAYQSGVSIQDIADANNMTVQEVYDQVVVEVK